MKKSGLNILVVLFFHIKKKFRTDTYQIPGLLLFTVSSSYKVAFYSHTLSHGVKMAVLYAS